GHMHKSIPILIAAAALSLPAFAQDRYRDRDHDRDHSANRVVVYEDRINDDRHEWNESEDRAYRRYLDENHHKYRDFAKANRREQENYWKWRHNHHDDDRR